MLFYESFTEVYELSVQRCLLFNVVMLFYESFTEVYELSVQRCLLFNVVMLFFMRASSIS